MGQNSIDIRIRLREAAKFAAETRAAREEIKGLGDEAERSNRKSKRAAGGLDQFQKSAKGLQGLFKPALIVAGVGLFAQLLTTASAAAVGLLAALAPVSGLLLALPAAFFMAAQGAGVLKLGLSGVGGALGGLNGQIDPKKFAALSEPGQRFVLTLDSMKAPIRDLQRRVQNGLFPGLTKGLKAAMPALHALLGPLGKTGGVFGNIGSRLGHLVGSRGFAKDLGDQANFNNVQLGRLGGAGIHLVNVFRHLMVAARPLVSWLVRLAGGWAANTDKSITAGRANGKLAGIFRVVQHAVSSVFKILGNVGHIIFNIGNLGRKHLGESLLGSLVKGSAALKKWTESGPGIAKITKFFTEAKPVVYGLAQLIGAVVKDLLAFGTGGSSGLVAFMAKVRTEMLPVFLTISKNLISIFSFISRSIPGGSWLLAIGYILTKLNGGGLITSAASGLGSLFGKTASRSAANAMEQEAGLFNKFGGLAGKASAAAFVAVMLVELNAHKGEIDNWLSKNFPKLPIVGNPFAPGANPIHSADNGFKKAVESNINRQNEKEALVPGMAPGPWKAQRERHLVSPFPGGLPGLVHSHRKTPGLALGGMITRSGLVEIGERGPELLSLPRGAAVTPLAPSLSAPAMARVERSGSTPGWGHAPIHIQVHSQLKLTDGRPIAESTSEVMSVHKALK